MLSDHYDPSAKVLRLSQKVLPLFVYVQPLNPSAQISVVEAFILGLVNSKCVRQLLFAAAAEFRPCNLRQDDVLG